jgi:hypothetical protein
MNDFPSVAKSGEFEAVGGQFLFCALLPHQRVEHVQFVSFLSELANADVHQAVLNSPASVNELWRREASQTEP